MPIQKTITLYTFDELSSRVQENLIRRRVAHAARNFTPFDRGTFLGILRILGFTGDEEILYTGFNTDFDGTCILGSARISPESLRATLALRSVLLCDSTKNALKSIKTILETSESSLELRISQSGRYSNSSSMEYNMRLSKSDKKIPASEFLIRLVRDVFTKMCSNIFESYLEDFNIETSKSQLKKMLEQEKNSLYLKNGDLFSC